MTIQSRPTAASATFRNRSGWRPWLSSSLLIRLLLVSLFSISLLSCDREPKPELEPDPTEKERIRADSEEAGSEEGDPATRANPSGGGDGDSVTDADRQALLERVQARGETMVQQRYEIDMAEVINRQFTAFEVELARSIPQEEWQARRVTGELVVSWDGDFPSMEEAIESGLEKARWLEKKVERKGEVVFGLKDEEALGKEVFAQASAVVRERLEAMDVQDALVLVEGGQIVVEGSSATLNQAQLANPTGSLSIALARDPNESRRLLQPLVDAVDDGNLLAHHAYNGSLTAHSGLNGHDEPCKGLRSLVEESDLSRHWVGYELTEQDGQNVCRLWLREEPPVLDPVEVLDAFPASNPQLQSNYVALELVPSHARVFSDFTANHVGEPTLIALGDEVLLAPVIRSEIPGGKISIEFGHLTSPAEQLKRATEVSSQLRAGSLSAPLKKISEVRLDPPAP